MTDLIAELSRILQARRDADPESSYVAGLYAKGLNAILEKVGEEATETLIAAKDSAARRTAGRDDPLIHEVADLWFHCLVMLVHLEQDPRWVLDELASRLGTSGLTEKANRKPD